MMRIARFGQLGEEFPAASVGTAWYDISSITPDITGDFLASGGVARALDAIGAGTLPVIDTSHLRIGAPIARPGAVVGIGMNYAAHAAESGGEVPSSPIVFLKPASSVAGPFDDFRLGPNFESMDWEVELGVVIGSRAHRLPTVESAPGFVAGFVLANDLSERRLQLEQPGGQWTLGKCAEGSTPIGPWLVPATTGLNPSNLWMSSHVNGATRQFSSTADMVFDVNYLVYFLSQHMVLEPGDLVLTGTPEGVALSGRFPYLGSGDITEVEIEGLGSQRHRVLAWSSEH